MADLKNGMPDTEERETAFLSAPKGISYIEKMASDSLILRWVLAV